MKFLLDAHFPIKLKDWLINNGFDTIHTAELFKGNLSSDRDIIEFAEIQNRIIITKDSDFLKYRILHQKPAFLLMVTTGNIKNRDLFNLFESQFLIILEAYNKNHKVIEINTHSIIIHE
jgi:predicted nuclease of predicted toxin-antitoxin system